jgi:phosphoribosyl 1,2-cyclic phosphate phosphodiesterase
MDDIRAYNYVSKSPMDIYATLAVQEALKREFNYVFSGSNYPGIPEVKLVTFDQDTLHFFGEKIIPIDVMHYKLPVKAFRIRNFSYITDANFIDEVGFKKLQGTEILVINALRIEPHISHFNLAEALEIIERIKPKKAYLTHISHLLGLHDEVSKILPPNVEIAYDGLQIDIA